MKKIASIVGIFLVMGLLLSLAPPAMAAVDTEQAAPSSPLLDNGPGKDKGMSWHQEEKVTVLKGKVEGATLGDNEITITLEEGQTIKVSQDAIKGPLESRIWGGIEGLEALEGSEIVALVYKDGDVYIAKHISIIPGRTYAHYCGEVTSFTQYSDGEDGSITIEQDKPVNGSDDLSFAIVEQTKFPNGEPEGGDWVTVVAQKPYEENMTALAVVSSQKPPLPPEVTRLEGIITNISNDTITLDAEGVSKSVIYNPETVFIIKGAALTEDNKAIVIVGQEAVVIAQEGDDGELLAKGVFVGLEPALVTQWLERYEKGVAEASEA